MPASPVEVDEQVEQVDLVGDVEEGRRLVEQEQVRVLGEGHRDPGPLSLAARKRGERPVHEVGDAGRVERPGDRCGVILGPAPEPALVRVATAPDEVADGDPVRRDRRLGEQPEHAGHLDGRHLGDRAAIEQDGAAARPQEPGQASQEGRLPGRVGPDDHRDPAVRDLDGQAADDIRSVVAEGQVLGPEPVVVPPVGLAHRLSRPDRIGSSWPAARRGTARR